MPSREPTREPPLVSVIIPTHNRPRLLLRALDSVLSQSLADFEVLIVNDGGPELGASYASRDPQGRIRLIHRPKSGGVSAARNEGLRAARGRYIAYLDDDDIFLPRHLEALSSALQASPHRFAYADARRASFEGRGESGRITRRDYPYCRDYSRNLLLFRNYMPTLCVMHERSLAEEVGYFDESFPVSEDWELWCRMSEHTDFLHVPESTCEFLIRNDDQGLSTGKAKLFPQYEAEIRRRNNLPAEAADFAADYLYKSMRQTQARRLRNADNAESRWALQTILAHDPSDARAACELSAFLLAGGNAPAGLELLRRVVAALPQLLGARVLLGYGYLAMGSLAAAIKVLEEHDGPLDTAGAQLLRGDIHLALGEYLEAKSAYRQTAAVDPSATGEAVARLSNLDVVMHPRTADNDNGRTSTAPSKRGRLTPVSRPHLGHRVVPVLGFHRSGTSMFTHMLQQMGVDLGGPLLPPAADNPRGFWEHSQFLGVNQSLLRATGTDVDGFDVPSRLRASAENVAQFAGPALEGVEMLMEENGFSGGPWGFKDPRTVITLPFWLEMFRRLKIDDVRPVVVLRSPAACARSLLKRRDILRAVPQGQDPERYILRMWAAYAELIEKNTPEGALWLQQEDLVHPQRGEQALLLCADYLGLRPIQVAPAMAAIAHELVHHNIDDEASCGVADIDALYQRQRERATLPAPRQRLRHPKTPLRASEDKYCIFVARDSVSTYARPFEEVALALHYGFAHLGMNVPIVEELWLAVGRPIVLGPQLLSETMAQALPADAILFNLEQVSPESRWFSPQYIALLKRHRVWDYAEPNLAGLRALGIHHAELCPIGVEPEMAFMESLPDAEKDIDVLFYGAINPRRRQVLKQLVEAGLHVAVLSNVFGAQRDDFIRRAKIVINVHFYEAQILELVRLSYLMVNGACVVSEPGSQSELVESLAEGVLFSSYADLVSSCVDLAFDRERRERLSKAARACALRRPQHTFLAPLIRTGTDTRTVSA